MNIQELPIIAEQAFQYAKTQNVCTGYNRFPLPPGCAPAACKIAFDWRGDTRLLLVEQGVRYSGNHAMFRNFLQTGEHAESTAEAMQRFIISLREAYGNAPAPQSSNPHLRGVVDTSQIVVNPFSMRLDPAALLADLKAEIIGQAQALEGMVNVAYTHIRKRKSERPATLLFAGPTGTGKTKTAEQLAPLLTKHTGADWGYIRVDMNQMAEAHHANRLLGAPPGYVGYEETPLLAPLVANPRHILLFDEMEKASPKVLQILMNAMASGRLETPKPIDGQRVYDFRKCVMLFTSNLPLLMDEPEEMSQADITRACRKQLTKSTDGGPTMPPEIAARFTDILLFRELSEQDKVDILAISMLRIGEQYDLNIRHIDTGLLQATVDELDVSNGVREAEYMLEAMLGTPLAAFADSHDTQEVALSGDTRTIQVNPYQ